MLVSYDAVARTVTIDFEDGTLPAEWAVSAFAVLYYGETSAAAIAREDGIELSFRPSEMNPVPLVARMSDTRWFLDLGTHGD